MSINVRQAGPADLEHVLAVYKDVGFEMRGSLSLEAARAVFEKMASSPTTSVRVWASCVTDIASEWSWTESSGGHHDRLQE